MVSVVLGLDDHFLVIFVVLLVNLHPGTVGSSLAVASASATASASAFAATSRAASAAAFGVGFGGASGLSHGGFRLLLDLLMLLHRDVMGNDDNFLLVYLGHFLVGGAAAASGVGAASALASGVALSALSTVASGAAFSRLASGAAFSRLASGLASGAAFSGVASGVLLGAHGSLLHSPHGRSGLPHGALRLLLDDLLVVFVIGVVIITLDG